MRGISAVLCCALTEGQILVLNVMISTLSLSLSLDDDNFDVEFIIIIIVIVKRSNDLIKSGLTRYYRYKCSVVRGNKCLFISLGIAPRIFWPWR